MVSKGLKVGDTFTEGKFLYKVTAVDYMGNYVSSLVGLASEGAKIPKVVPEVKETIAYEDMPYSDLKRIAKEKGVSAKGSKEEVIERLKGV